METGAVGGGSVVIVRPEAGCQVSVAVMDALTMKYTLPDPEPTLAPLDVGALVLG